MVKLPIDQSQSDSSSTTQSGTSSSSQSTRLTDKGYTGSSFAGMLVIILFLIWFFYRTGILQQK